MLERQNEIAHAKRKLAKPCPFCGMVASELWFDPSQCRGDLPYQVRCGACGARGPRADCGDEAAVPSWESVMSNKK